MREISFVKRLKFNFTGSVAKRALVLGDADNDQYNELVCANLQGDLAIFKDRSPDRFAHASDLGMVTACLIGDLINAGRNQLGAINTEGILHVFDVQDDVQSQLSSNRSSRTRQSQQTVRGDHIQALAPDTADSVSQSGFVLNPLHRQRLPANCKELLMADLDGDGQNELIVGLTDRVLRTYKWIKIGPNNRGKFVGLYKWEFADQIGAVSLNPSLHDRCVDIIVGQPGGTYAKLQYSNKAAAAATRTSSSFEALEGADQKQPAAAETSNQQKSTAAAAADSGADHGDTIKTDYIGKLTPEYHQLALGQVRNPQVSTEVLGGIREPRYRGGNRQEQQQAAQMSYLIVVATLDGTLMLVNKDEIVWLLQVDHQIFALAIIEPECADNCHPTLSQSESTCTIVPNLEHAANDSSANVSAKTALMNSGSRQSSRERSSSQYFAACAWNGKTYIIDEERNYLRFKFDEAVSAFTAGIYHFGGSAHTSLVYATFNNQIVLYFDVILDNIRPMYLINEVAPESGLGGETSSGLLEKLDALAKRLNYPSLYEESHVPGSSSDNQPVRSSLNKPLIHRLLQDILYGLPELDAIY